MPWILKEVKVKKDGDNQILTFTADASKMDSYVQEVMGSMASMPGLEGVTYTIKEVSGEATVDKDGYFSQIKMKMVMDMSISAWIWTWILCIIISDSLWKSQLRRI